MNGLADTVNFAEFLDLMDVGNTPLPLSNPLSRGKTPDNNGSFSPAIQLDLLCSNRTALPFFSLNLLIATENRAVSPP